MRFFRDVSRSFSIINLTWEINIQVNVLADTIFFNINITYCK